MHHLFEIENAGTKQKTSVADPWHFGTDPDADTDPWIRTSDYWIQMQIREAQKHTDPTDPDLDADSEHWYIYIILQR